jgi:rhamnosyltransferase
MEKVCAVVISYNPSASIVENINTLICQVSKVVIVDNGSCDDSKHYLEILSKDHNVTFFYNNKNIGIAAALNIGVKYALETGYFWVATFDQDSKITPNFINTMLATYISCTCKEAVALIAPTYYDQKTKIKTSFGICKKENLLFKDLTTTMTSGNLVRTDIFRKVGYFNEDFFIDYVDNEFCLRCLKYGYKLIESRQAVLIHNLGDGRRHSFLWKQPATTNHNHIRRYYNARNRFVVYKKYFSLNTKWALKDISQLMREMIKIVLFEESSLLKLIFIFKGISHAFTGKMGKYE